MNPYPRQFESENYSRAIALASVATERIDPAEADTGVILTFAQLLATLAIADELHDMNTLIVSQMKRADRERNS